jgi:hypothetical protein
MSRYFFAAGFLEALAQGGKVRVSHSSENCIIFSNMPTDGGA